MSDAPVVLHQRARPLCTGSATDAAFDTGIDYDLLIPEVSTNQSDFLSQIDNLLAHISGAIADYSFAMTEADSILPIPPHSYWPAEQSVSTNRSQPAARWFTYVSRRFTEIGFGDTWGAVRPSQYVLTRAWKEALDLLQYDTLTPSVVPSEDNGIVFVWHKNSWDLEIEVLDEDTNVWAFNRNDDESWYGSLKDLRASVVDLLDTFST